MVFAKKKNLASVPGSAVKSQSGKVVVFDVSALDSADLHHDPGATGVRLLVGEPELSKCINFASNLFPFVTSNLIIFQREISYEDSKKVSESKKVVISFLHHVETESEESAD